MEKVYCKNEKYFYKNQNDKLESYLKVKKYFRKTRNREDIQQWEQIEKHIKMK